MVEFSRSMAFVIGINNYGNGISPLQNAVNDAKKLVEILQEKHKYQVWVCFDEIATLKTLNKLLEEILPQQVHSDDRLLFYFAGHGIALNGDDGPEGYLIPQDAKLGDTKTYLPMTQVQESLSELPCRHFLGILDCCFAGAFRWSTTRDLLPVPEVIHQERYDRFILDPAWQIITSAAYDQKALDAFALTTDRSQGNHSPFATALIEALEEGKADLYPPAEKGKQAGDGVITATDLYSYLRDRVEPATEGYSRRQTPGIWPLKKHDKGEYIFLTPGHQLNLPPAPPLDESKNPYRGLKSFDEEHSDLFFGRQALIEKLYQHILGQPLTVVLGTSGSGKSSLVKAGLIPYIKKHSQQQWRILAPMRPSESPLKALNNLLANENLPIPSLTSFTTEQKVQSVSATIAAWMQMNPNSKLLLVIDQFEELITLCYDEQERENFFNLLGFVVVNYSNQLRIVLTLRSDFEPQFENKALEPYWNSALFSVPVMTRAELRKAIEAPASARVMYFKSDDPNSDLIDHLIDEVADMPGTLPLLSFTLSELYFKYLQRQKIAQERGETIDRAITEADYKELGGVMRSLTKRADSEYEELVKQDQLYELTIRNVMLRMVAVGDEFARRRVPLSELEYPESDQERVIELISRFSAARLLVEGQDTESKPYVEPAHDALVRGWQKLLAWKKDEDEEGSLNQQRRLTPAAEEWKSVKTKEQPPVILAKAEPVVDLLDRTFDSAEDLLNKVNAKWVRSRRIPDNHEHLKEKPGQFLWNGNPYLDVLKEELKSKDNWFNKVEAEFVQRSIARKRRNIGLRWSIAFGVILVVSGLATIAMIGQRGDKIGQVSASIETAEVKLGSNHALDAMTYSLRAGKSLKHWLLKLFPPDPKLNEQVRGTLQTAVYTVKEYNRIEGHEGTVRSRFSPDGQLVATAGEDGVVSIWNLQGQKQAEWKNNQDSNLVALRNLSFSPDGKLLATAGEKGIVRLWNLQGQQQAELKGHKDRVRGISFSPNGQLVATSGEDSTVRLWDLHGNPIGQPFRGHQGEVWGVMFSPDGQRLASVGDDGFVRLWNLQGKQLKKWKADQDKLSSISFSPNGQLLATGGEDFTVRLWNLQGNPMGKAFKGHKGRVWSVVFSPDGQRLASAAAGDGAVLVWNLQGEQLDEFAGHQGPVRSVSFNPHDHQLLLSAGDDGTVRLWKHRHQTAELKGHQGRVRSVSFSPNGQQLASGGDDGFVRLWNLQGEQLREWKVAQGSFNSVSFSPDSQRLATDKEDGTIRLWNLQGQQLAELKGHQGRVRSVSFSPDGQQLASAGNDGTVRLWNLQGKELHQFQGHLGPVYSVVFSPDGKQLASGGDDGTVRLWNLQGYRNGPLFQLPANKVSSVAFSLDGKRIVMSGNNITEKDSVHLLDLQIQQLSEWKTHHISVNSISFSPDGKLLATAGENGTVNLWQIDSFDELMNRVCDQMHNYLENNLKVNKADRHLCN